MATCFVFVNRAQAFVLLDLGSAVSLISAEYMHYRGFSADRTTGTVMLHTCAGVVAVDLYTRVDVDLLGRHKQGVCLIIPVLP